VSNYTHNHDRTAKQCSIFDEFNSTADIPDTVSITLLEDCRGGECTYTKDASMISQALTDFSGDHSVRMKIAEDPSNNELILTLSDSCQHPASTSRIHSNMIGCTERDEDGWVWYSRGEFAFNKNGGRGYYENNI
jgi:hypothetical protein